MDLGSWGNGWRVWSGFNWLRIGTGGGLLWLRWWTFGFWRHEIRYVHCWDQIQLVEPKPVKRVT
jgi:hypothetical protein